MRIELYTGYKTFGEMPYYTRSAIVILVNDHIQVLGRPVITHFFTLYVYCQHIHGPKLIKIGKLHIKLSLW